MTNFQMIKNMSVDELAAFVDDMSSRCISDDCGDCPIGRMKDGMPCNTTDIGHWLNSDIDVTLVITSLSQIIKTIRDSESIKHKDTILPMLRDVVLRMTKHQSEGDI